MDESPIKKIIIVLALLCSIEAKSSERFEFYQGVRQLGMGGAGVGVVNDETALLINPAGLGKLRDHIVTVIDPEISMGLANSKILSKGNALGFLDPQELLNSLNKTPNTHFNGKGQVFPSVILPNFGIGVLGKYEINGDVNSSTDKFDYSYRNDFAGVLGYNLRLFSGILKLGVSGRYINRVEAIANVDSTRTDLTLKNLASQGVGLAADAGLILSVPVSLLPSIAATVRDAGNTTFKSGGGLFKGYVGQPATTKQTVDVAISIFPIFSNNSRGSFSVEFRDVMSAYEEKDYFRKLHTGFEYNLADALFLRAGLNQRYWTAGLEFATGVYQVQFASYGEEIGTDKVRREDRRLVSKFVFRF